MKNKIEEISINKYTNYFTDEFVQNHSPFNSFKQMWEYDKNKLKEKLPLFEYIKTEEWDEFIKDNTDFEDFVGMKFAATINDFKINKKHWFAND